MAQEQNKAIEQILEVLMENGFEKSVPQVIEILVNTAMLAERETYLNAKPYERTEQRVDVANGFKPKTVKTRFGELNLSIPQTRQSDFYPRCLEKGIRSERALVATIAEMYIQGVSTKKVTKILEEMCGVEVSSMQVTRCAKQLDSELNTWRNRPLQSFSYLVFDARYENVRCDGTVKKLAVIWAIGITEQGTREVLGVSVSLSEAEIHWRNFMKGLTSRGLTGVKYIVSDDHSGLKAALFSIFPNVIWNRCHTHLARNSQSYISRVSRKNEIGAEIRDILQSPDLETAKFLLDRFMSKWQKLESRLVEWAEINIPEGFNVFSLPRALHKKLRTSNLIERMNQELKRRSTVVRIFPNEDSCLRLMSAIAMEIHEDWSTGRKYFSDDLLLELNETVELEIYRKKVA